jgi:hypothetical protein
LAASECSYSAAEKEVYFSLEVKTVLRYSIALVEEIDE